MKKKLLAIVLATLLCMTTFIISRETVTATGSGRTLYVGGSTFGNYSSIQSAIDNATSGNTTIYVYEGTYNENIVINKTVNLTGEGSETVIDGRGIGCAVTITADWVNLSGFTIQNCGEEEYDAGVLLTADHCNISETIIMNCCANGILLVNASHTILNRNDFINISISAVLLWNASTNNHIARNNFTSCGFGIEAGNGSNNNTIEDNSFDNSSCGVFLRLDTTCDNLIRRNTFIDTVYGTLIEEATNNTIIENLFTRNHYGVRILAVNSTSKNSVFHNNFIDNTLHFFDECNQTWDDGYPSAGNYWDDGHGTDIFKGPSQNLSGSDGIVDNPYPEFDNLTIDRYPLTQPWGTYDPIPSFTATVNVRLASFNASASYDRDGNIINWTWSFGDTFTGYGEMTSHSYLENNAYNVTLTITDNEGKNNTFSSHIVVGNDTQPPVITSVSNSPETVGFGFNVSISANVTDNYDVDNVFVNITYPNNLSENFAMIRITENKYRFEFNDTWRNGRYNYTILAVDYSNNSNSSNVYDFIVSSEAVITVCTVKDNYGDNEYFNLTDPPGVPEPSLGYELLDDGAVLHLWNQFDSYYFNTSSGIQLTNHKDQYWSHNVLMLGYYNNDQWNLLYRTDDLTGFNRDIEIDETSYVNVTLWKDLSYGGYLFRLAVRYHLGVYNNDLTVIPSIKNIGSSSIPYVLGFGWELKDIQINMTAEGDYILVDQDKYLLNQTLDNSYTSLNDTVFYLMEDVTGSQTKSLYLRWNPDLSYKLLVKSRSGQQNAPVTLFIRIGTLAVGQQKHTLLRWYDASQETFYFNGFDENEAWEFDPELMTDGDVETFAKSCSNNEVEFCTLNTYEGDGRGAILKVELRTYGYYDDEQGNITLVPVFGENRGENYTFVPTDRAEWSSWFDITNDEGRGSGQWITPWEWSEVETLGCHVISHASKGTTLYCSKVELRVTYNTAPVVSNPSPLYGVNGVGLQPWVNITVSDPDGDSMNVTWYSNSTSSLLTLRPNANGSSTQLSRYPGSAAANYLCVDEAVADDADYVYWSGTTWKNDTYNLVNHGTASGVIHSVTVYARCNRGGIGGYPSVPNEGKIVIKSGSSYYFGNEFTPTSTFTSYSHTWAVNPATDHPWSWSAVDALEAGLAFIGNEAGASKCSQVYVVVNYTNPNTWVQFGSNSSVSNGIYRQQFFNASVNGQWWYWKVKADDGILSTWSSVYKFYTGYQSKIENTGDTNMKGYLLIQVQLYNATTGTWMVDVDAINETEPRTILSGNQLGLDNVFNGVVNSWNLSSSNGTYRVYAALRDNGGAVLQVGSLALNASHEFSVSMDYDSDDDGWTDYYELRLWCTNPLDDDTDNDGVPDPDDIDPLTNLSVTLTTKRVYASKYSYTWREAENWDYSVTNTSAEGDNTDWLIIADGNASGGFYTRQNDSMEGSNDNASWHFTVQKSGIYFFWMRCHRYINASSNVCLTWENSTGSYRIFDRLWDDGGLGYEVSWRSNTSNEWKWSWYGVLYLNEGDEGKLNLTNIVETEEDYPTEKCGNLSGRGHFEEQWMEVDNILITDDPSCHPTGKGRENSQDSTIGYNIGYLFDPMPPDIPYPDFYVKATIAGITRSSDTDLGVWWDTEDVLEDWTTTVDVPDQKGNENVSIVLELYDEDGSEDFLVDICREPGRKTCILTYNLMNATWWGDDALLDIDFLGRTSGEVDGDGPLDGNVIFEITQNDADGDHITYWQESEEGTFGHLPPVDMGTKNEKRAVIVGAGASCKLKQTGNEGSATWQPGRGWLYQGPHFVYEKGASWDDYTVSVDIMTKEFYSLSNEQIGVMFRYQDEDNYYLLRWQKRHLRDRICLEKVVGGSLTSLDDTYWPLQRADWYTVRISVDGSHIQVFVNNNKHEQWWKMLDLTDNSGLASGTIGMWCWKNRQAWFDDIIVEDIDTEHTLLAEGFDYGKIFSWSAAGNPAGSWTNTTRSIDQEDFYLQPDFVYRVMRLVGHYEPENIVYLSAARWRDADGDGENDVSNLSRVRHVKNAFSSWLRDAGRDNLSFVYVFDHGTYFRFLDYSVFSIDDDGDGIAYGLSDFISDRKVDRWLPFFSPYLPWGHGRLTFVIEACYVGHFNQALSKPLQQRILISSSSYNTSAPPETGQDWPAFTHMFFKMLANGSTNVFDAFHVADKHVNLTNFMSRWAPTYVAKTRLLHPFDPDIIPRWVQQDAKLNDNGDMIDSDWFQGNDGILSRHTGI